jgi:hypothetical protein
MRGVRFLDLRGVRALLAGARMARAMSAQMVVIGLNRVGARVVRLCDTAGELTLGALPEDPACSRRAPAETPGAGLASAGHAAAAG